MLALSLLFAAVLATTAPVAGASSRALEPTIGETIQAELAAHAVDTYRLQLPEHHYLQIVAHQQHLDVVLRLVAPDGDELVRCNGVGGRKVAELLSLVTEHAGEHLLEVSAAGNGEAGPYSLEITAARTAWPEDAQRVVADTLYAHATHLQSLPDDSARRDAIETFRRAIPLWQQLGETAEQARMLNQIGMTYRRLGDTSQALSYFQESLPMWRAAADAVGEANALNNIGRAYRQLGELPTAIDYYRQALDRWRLLQDSARAARTLNNLGQASYLLGDAEAALAAYQEAIAALSTDDRRGRANLLNSVGQCYRMLGDTAAAASYFDQALELSRQAGERSIEAAALCNLANIHRQQGEIHKALEAYHRALELNRKIGDPVMLAPVLENLGTTHFQLGQHGEALRLFEEALNLYRRIGNDNAANLVVREMSTVRIAQGDLEVASKDLEQALVSSRQSDDRRTEAEVLMTLGAAHLAADRPLQAQASFQDSLEIWRQLGHRVNEARVLAFLGRTAHALRQLPESRKLLTAAVDLSRRNRDRWTEASALSQLAWTERDAGQLEVAKQRIESALAIVETQRSNVRNPDFQLTFFARKRHDYEGYIDLLIRLHDAHRDRGYDIAAFEASERARARGLLDLLHERSQEVERGIDPRLKQQERQLAARRSQIQTRLLAAQASAAEDMHKLDDLERQLAETEAERSRLVWEIRRRHPRYAELQYPEPLRLQQVQQLLPPRTALLEYALGSEGALLFVVTKRTIESFRLAASAADIEALVERARAGLKRPGRRRFGEAKMALHLLYQLLVEPAGALLEDQLHLVIAPDRGLHYLPFETLRSQPPDNHADNYLIERFAVSYVPSASVLASLAELTSPPSPSGKLFVAFADPVYGREEPTGDTVDAPAESGERSLEFPRQLQRLPQAGREARQIADLYAPQDVALFLRQDASEENVKQARVLHQARWLHFAAHGLLDEGHSDYYGIALTLDDDPREDGLLQVYEIFNLELNAELVVLSACETGLGKAVSGEGLIGLTRAFIYAGTPRVVVSLWRVADRSSADLMVELYRRLAETDSPAEALRHAKLSLLRDPRYAHPYHWAPFVLVGKSH